MAKVRQNYGVYSSVFQQTLMRAGFFSLLFFFSEAKELHFLYTLQYFFHSIKRREPKCLIQNPPYSSQINSSQNITHVSSFYYPSFFLCNSSSRAPSSKTLPTVNHFFLHLKLVQYDVLDLY